MNAHAKAWVKALRSGKFAQAKHHLHIIRTDSFCCLGVGCELAKRLLKLIVKPSASNLFTLYNNHGGSLPTEVKKYLGLRTFTGDFRIYSANGTAYFYNLADLNDVGFKFNQIADIIEWEPLGLFVDEPKKPKRGKK